MLTNIVETIKNTLITLLVTINKLVFLNSLIAMKNNNNNIIAEFNLIASAKPKENPKINHDSQPDLLSKIERRNR